MAQNHTRAHAGLPRVSVLLSVSSDSHRDRKPFDRAIFENNYLSEEFAYWFLLFPSGVRAL